MRAKAISKAKVETIPDATLEPTTKTRARELTPREIEVIRLLWEEFTAKEIGVRLGISPRTVEAHRWNICAKIRAKNIVGIIKFALKSGIVKL